MLSRKDLLIGTIRHHLVTIIAWMDLPDRSARLTGEATAAMHECRRELKITMDEISRRKHYLGVPEEEC